MTHFCGGGGRLAKRTVFIARITGNRITVSATTHKPISEVEVAKNRDKGMPVKWGREKGNGLSSIFGAVATQILTERTR